MIFTVGSISRILFQLPLVVTFYKWRETLSGQRPSEANVILGDLIIIDSRSEGDTRGLL